MLELHRLSAFAHSFGSEPFGSVNDDWSQSYSKIWILYTRQNCDLNNDTDETCYPNNKRE